MSTFKCLYCGIPLSASQNSHTTYINEYGTCSRINENEKHFEITVYRCPDCKEPMLFAKSVNMLDFETLVYPQSAAIKFPDYIPEQIRQDYEEAYSILNLSPKASATLSRRCLQGMIHDFFGIQDKNLNREISQLKDKISPAEWNAIDSIRQLGNIGAHMEKDINLIVDIDSSEAEILLKVIENFIQAWYISRHETDELLKSIVDINNQKQSKRNQ